MMFRVIFVICMLALTSVAHAKSVHLSVTSRVIGFVQHKYKRPKQQATTIAKSIVKHANANKLDPYLVTSLIARESSFNPRAAKQRARGLMQVSLIHKKLIKRPILNIDYNIQLGTNLLRTCLATEANGVVSKALALYNVGCSHNNVRAKLRQGKAYANKVLAEVNIIKNWSKL